MLFRSSPDTDEKLRTDDEESDEEEPVVMKKGRPTKKSRVEVEVVEDNMEPLKDDLIEKPVKKDSMLYLLTVMSDCVGVVPTPYIT